jgi:hypothetical protein
MLLCSENLSSCYDSVRETPIWIEERKNCARYLYPHTQTMTSTGTSLSHAYICKPNLSSHLISWKHLLSQNLSFRSWILFPCIRQNVDWIYSIVTVFFKDLAFSQKSVAKKCQYFHGFSKNHSGSKSSIFLNLFVQKLEFPKELTRHVGGLVFKMPSRIEEFETTQFLRLRKLCRENFE